MSDVIAEIASLEKELTDATDVLPISPKLTLCEELARAGFLRTNRRITPV